PPLGARPGEPEVRDRDVHEMRVALADFPRREPVATLALDAEVLDQDVGAIAELAEPAPPVPCVEIDDGAALVRVPVEEREGAVGRFDVVRERRPEPAGIAARRLDLDHVGAEVAEEPPRKGPAQIGEIDDPEMRERRGHGAVYSARASSGK